MHPLNLILNLVGLVLWLGWRPVGFEALDGPPTAPRPKGGRFPPLRWVFLLGVVVLVTGRSWLYWRVGHDVGWIARLDLGVVVIDFNSAVPGRMLAFSVASFALFLGGWFLWLSLLGAVNRRSREANPWLRVVAGQLGWLSRVPAWVSLVWPVLLLGGAWAAMQPYLEQSGMAVAPRSSPHLAQQSAVVGLGAWLGWRYLVVGVLFAHVVNSYLYLGNPPFLDYLGLTARNLLQPLARLPLRAGPVDIRPVVGIALALLVFTLAHAGLIRLFTRLPL